ncbi:MAG: BrnT family toxin, partial [Alphaproteobacteria bacterium]|nr:BrnT family toxin [Alphaproteobacteria bacterium]
MRITYDRAKRATTLKERGLDFADAKLVFAGRPR